MGYRLPTDLRSILQERVEEGDGEGSKDSKREGLHVREKEMKRMQLKRSSLTALSTFLDFLK